jgi:hypothetical protein
MQRDRETTRNGRLKRLLPKNKHLSALLEQQTSTHCIAKRSKSSLSAPPSWILLRMVACLYMLVRTRLTSRARSD